MTEVTPLRRETPTWDADGYAFKDVIVDGGGRWWMRTSDHRYWITFGSHIRHHIDQILQPVALIARAGETTDLVRARQTAMALMDENEALRRELACQQKYLDVIAGRIAGLTENVGDARQDIKLALAKVDPLRGGE